MLSVLSSFVHTAKHISMKGDISKPVLKVLKKTPLMDEIWTSCFVKSNFKVNSSVSVFSSLKLSPGVLR
jgi:hypothetical protein